MDSVSSLSVVTHVHLCSLAFVVVHRSTLYRARVGGWSPLRRLLPCSRPRRCRRRPWGGNRWWTLPGSSRITLGVRPRVAVALCSFAPPAPCVLAPHARVRGLGPCPAPALDLLGLPLPAGRAASPGPTHGLTGRWMVSPTRLRQDIRGGHPARTVTQMSASRPCKRAVARRRAAVVPARGGASLCTGWFNTHQG
jgi:hypothetical protein